MKLVDNVLVFDTFKIKAKEGTLDDALIRVDKLKKLLLIGKYTFPLAQLNKFSPAAQGTLEQAENKLSITLDYLVYTPNVITFKTKPTKEEGQQVSFTIQHNNQSIVLTNLVEQEMSIQHNPAESVIITAINYSTGAIDTITQKPETGQYYELAATSSSHVEGELSTVGGELVQGGELKNVCVSEVYDFENAPVALDISWRKEFGGLNSGYSFPAGTTDSTRQTYLQNLYLQYLMGTISSNPGMATSYPEYNALVSNLITEQKYLNHTGIFPMTKEIVETFFKIQSGTVFTSPATFSSNIIYWYDTSPYRFKGSAELLPWTSKVKFEKDKDYIIYWEINPNAPEVELGAVVPSTDPAYETTQSLHISTHVDIQVKVLGPLTKKCVGYQTIDTRYSYTTPVITTDTRRTVYTTELIVTPLN